MVETEPKRLGMEGEDSERNGEAQQDEQNNRPFHVSDNYSRGRICSPIFLFLRPFGISLPQNFRVLFSFHLRVFLSRNTNLPLLVP